MAIALQKSWIFAPFANVIEDVLSRLVDRALLSRVQPPRSQHGRARLDGRARLGIRLARFLDRFRDAKKQSIAATSVR